MVERVLAREHNFYTLRFEHADTVSELLEHHGRLPRFPHVPHGGW